MSTNMTFAYVFFKADQATLDKEGSGRVDRSLEDNGKQWRASNDRQL